MVLQSRKYWDIQREHWRSASTSPGIRIKSLGGYFMCRQDLSEQIWDVIFRKAWLKRLALIGMWKLGPQSVVNKWKFTLPRLCKPYALCWTRFFPSESRILIHARQSVPARPAPQLDLSWASPGRNNTQMFGHFVMWRRGHSATSWDGKTEKTWTPSGTVPFPHMMQPCSLTPLL